MYEQIIRETKKILNLDIESACDVIAAFDNNLNYIVANPAACELLHKQKHELEGKNLLSLFPSLTASVSHRHLLSALSGKTVLDVISEGNITKEGAKFSTDYYPLFGNKKVYAVLAHTRLVYFPK
jgi:PAS domain S-box-containing protein